ncbi:hypothetical protein M5D96_011645, partial [Drosophila gunungcola]
RRRRWAGTRIKGGGNPAEGSAPISFPYRSNSAPDRNSVKTEQHILFATYWDQPPQCIITLKGHHNIIFQLNFTKVKQSDMCISRTKEYT